MKSLWIHYGVAQWMHARWIIEYRIECSAAPGCVALNIEMNAAYSSSKQQQTSFLKRNSCCAQTIKSAASPKPKHQQKESNSGHFLWWWLCPAGVCWTRWTAPPMSSRTTCVTRRRCRRVPGETDSRVRSTVCCLNGASGPAANWWEKFRRPAGQNEAPILVCLEYWVQDQVELD